MRHAKSQPTDHRSYIVSPIRPVCGIEAEFQTICDQKECSPEDLFGSFDAVIPRGAVPWAGKPLPLPNGGVTYLDRGVIEIVTPPIELSPDSARQAVECLWKQIHWVRQHLDTWERCTGRHVRLRGFSAHYNVSFDPALRDKNRNLARLAYLLCHILPFPIILLATNNASTGVGVRPRHNRLEITVDFTPRPDLMIATAATILGLVTHVMSWETYRIEELKHRSLPQLAFFCPTRHASRHGWLAHYSSFSVNPFKVVNSSELWQTKHHGLLTINELSELVVKDHWDSIKAYAGARTRDLIWGIITGSTPGLRHSTASPDGYDNVRGTPSASIPRGSPKRYAGLLARCYEGTPVSMKGSTFMPRRVLGWFVIEFLERETGRTRIFTLDEIIRSSPKWTAKSERHRTGLDPRIVPTDKPEKTLR